jgi:GntR family transcriptional regulator, arabinose operon transcriptional repressor
MSTAYRPPKYKIVESLLRAQLAEGKLHEGMKLPSEETLAKEFGVAYGTIRQAINGLVQDGLLVRVRGSGTYVRAGEASSQATPLLVLIVPSLQGLWNVAGFYYLPAIVQGFCVEATRLGYEPMIIGGAAELLRLTKNSASSIGGIACLLVQEEDNRTAEKLSELGFPLICINAYHGRRALASISADQRQGIETVVTLLARHGHRRIAFLPGSAGTLGPMERFQAFRAAMKRHHLEPVLPPRYHTETVSTQTSEASAYLHQLLARPAAPTAIVAAGDMLALGTLQVLQQTGLRVPEDISLVGFGDYSVSQFLKPALTTVHLPLSELGVEAALYLDQRRTGQEKRRRILLPVTLIERETVGPPPLRAPSVVPSAAPTPIIPSPRFIKSSR